MAIKLYEIFSGAELKIAEKIQQRRLQMLVHSYIYYELNDSIVSDNQWSHWAEELKDLQDTHPDISEKVPYLPGFENWDASTGAFLPYRDKHIIYIANKLLETPKPKTTIKPKETKKRLF